ncbi:S-adenosyl-L-methionine-dependent methyltransferase [Purpureocillium lavendulum]|uniref:S-adenosyl-L-methionine-dependent methyltransferase n=1 Tax=Purpureocillium lavendulum TaxID=1247861 RepID=A0AB34FUR0_9HYPO|nr:S-adenosyl-L-methionine-dependent methyltransferase [Purpureocillium lavendulum]
MGSMITSDASNQGNPKDGIPWYLDTLENIPPLAQRVLVEHGGLKPDEVRDHIMKIASREKAWASSPYPCVGLFRFLDYSLPDSPLYGEVLQRLKGGEKLLDFGCCFGHDLRALVADGVPAENLCGAELNATFLDLGYQLFRDKDRIKTPFYTANVFDEDDALRKERRDEFDIIHLGSFLHLFDYDGQKRAATALLKLLKRQPGGSLILGRQHGATKAKEVQNYLYKPTKESESNGRLPTFFNHDADSFRGMWDEIGEQTGLRFEVGTEWGTWGAANGMDPAYYKLWSWEDKDTLRFKFWVRVL